jgi:hypothetical protein
MSGIANVELLRKIERNKWLDNPEWVPAGEVVADALGDLATTGGALSIWAVGEGCDNDRLIAAMAAHRNKVASLDFFSVSARALRRAGFKIEQKPGDSPDRDLNRACHHHILDLTERSLVRLAAFFRHEGEHKTWIPRNWGPLIQAAVDNKHFSPTAIKPKVKDWLDAQGIEIPG